MRPTVYERKIMPMGIKLPSTRIGFLRNPTLRDISNLLSYVKNQDFYDFQIRFVDVATDDFAVSDYPNLRGLAETKEHGEKPLKKTFVSEIYFETPDERYAGTIRNSFFFSPFSSMLGLPEALVSLLFIGMGVSNSSAEMTSAGAILGADAFRRISNSTKTKALELVAGPQKDIFSYKKYMINPSIFISKSIKMFSENPAYTFDDYLREQEKDRLRRETYSLDEIKKFREFTAYLERINL